MSEADAATTAFPSTSDSHATDANVRYPTMGVILGGGYEGYAYPHSVVKVVMCSRGGSASEVETHKNIDSVLLTKTTFQAHSIFSVSIQK